MPILEVNGRRVEVGPEFMGLTPQEQEAEVDEIAASFGQPQPSADVTGGFGERAQRETIEPETPELRREIDRSKAVAGYNQLPWHQKELTDLNDAVRLAASGASFGIADRLAALGGSTLEEEQAKTQAARDRQNWLGTAVEAAGSIASIPAKGIGLVRNLPAMVQGASTAAKVGAGATRAGALAAEGAVIGGANALGRGEDVNTSAAVGGLAGPVGAAAGRAVGTVAGALGKKPALSSIADMEDVGRAAFKRADDAKVIVKPTWTNEVARDIRDGLTEIGWHPQLSSKPMAVIDMLDERLTQNVTLKDIHTLRRVAQNIGASTDPFERFVSGQMVKKIDKHIDRMKPGDVLSGNKTEGIKAFREGQAFWRTARKAEVVQEAVEKAERLSDGQNTSFHKALQTQFRGIMNSKTRRRGFSTEELAMMDKLARGNQTQKVLGWVSALAPTNKLNLMMQGIGGAASGGAYLPAQAGLAVVGGAAQFAGTRMARNNIYGLARLIRQQGLTPQLQAQIKKMPRARQQRLARVLQGWGVGGAEIPE
jgi:hypothetical protein